MQQALDADQAGHNELALELYTQAVEQAIGAVSLIFIQL